ncbi:DoxX family protein [Chitinophaga arvensicola]|nr:DoxX family protein [Chitinophaga arvensicola]
MKNKADIYQLFLRFALGASYLCAGLDRFGVWGPAGAAHVSWGNWQNFMVYAQKLMFFLPYSMASFFAALASGAEILFALLLITGWYTRQAAIGSGVLTLCFALSMTIALGIAQPLNYSVFTASAASFLLSSLPAYRWSMDQWLRKRQD